MGDYRNALANPSLWDRLDWPLERKAFIARLEELNDVRNNVMHFNPDPVPALAAEQIRALTRLIRQYAT